MKTQIQINDKETEIYIRFQHNQFNHTEKMDKPLSKYPLLNGMTICYLMKEDNSLLNSGHSSCTINDTFSKEIGRKISLTRAVKELPKSERTKIWEAYLNRANI